MELNRKYVNAYNKRQNQVLATFEMLKATKNAQKLEEISLQSKKLMNEGNAIMRRINQRLLKQ